MAVKPNERIEFFLAKAAGEDIDTKTLTPPGPINAIERALDKIADRIDDIVDDIEEVSEDVENASGGILVVNAAAETVNDNLTYTLDKTWQEIKNAFDSGTIPFVVKEASGDDVGARISPVDSIVFSEGEYYITAGSDGYVAETADDYPCTIGNKY